MSFVFSQMFFYKPTNDNKRPFGRTETHVRITLAQAVDHAQRRRSASLNSRHPVLVLHLVATYFLGYLSFSPSYLREVDHPELQTHLQA